MKPAANQFDSNLEDTSFDAYQDSSECESIGLNQEDNTEETSSESKDRKLPISPSLVQDTEKTRIPKPLVRIYNPNAALNRNCGGDQKCNATDYYTASSINFRKRRSVSLMEIQRMRKGSRTSKSIVHQSQESGHNLALQPSSRGDNCCYERSSLQLRNDYYCFVSENEESEVDSKLAGMRVFASIMLNAWRRRRDEVRRLNDELNRIKKGSVKTKNQIHVISSLFKVEQKTNDDLSCRLRRCLEDQQKLQDMYNDLNKAFTGLQVKFGETEQLVEEKVKEIDGLNYLLSESKTNLFKSMSRERELETNLSNEQRKLLELENEKNELLSTIAQLQQTINAKAEVESALTSKSKEVEYLKSQLDTLEKKLKDLKEKEAQVKEYQQLDLTNRKLIQELSERINFLEGTLKNSFMTRALEFCKQLHKSTYMYSHLLLYCLLPMTPPPTKISLNTTHALEKALNFCWR